MDWTKIVSCVCTARRVRDPYRYFYTAPDIHLHSLDPFRIPSVSALTALFVQPRVLINAPMHFAGWTLALVLRP